MIRAGLLFLLIWALMGGLILGWRHITRSDVTITGKVMVAGVIALVLATIIFTLESA